MKTFISFGVRQLDMIKMEVRKRKCLRAKEKTHMELALESADAQCGRCYPPTPLDCIGNCKVWRFRNELRQLCPILAEKDFRNILLNTLKNQRRLKMLEMLSKNSYSIAQLQQELKTLGYSHSRETILNEYVEPLVAVGLVAANLYHYRTTAFGIEMSQLFAGLHEIEDVLRPHSECYEEKIVEALFEGPKTYEELKLVIPNESLKRALGRLLQANLLTKSGENNYVFYFRTKRPSKKETLSSTEKRVYENISEEGTTGEELAKKAQISLRRTYKYIRKLKGKKLVFKRKCPKIYVLTAEGAKIAVLLEKLCALIREFTEASVAVTTKTFEEAQRVPTLKASKNEKEEESVPVLVRHGS
jgi:predicted transcriptional regulator